MRNKSLEKIEIYKGDITELQVDAIVNAANTSLLGGGGVDGAIHRVAGPDLLTECRSIGGCRTGEAVITAGYQLLARYVIHTVGPIYSGSPEDPILLAGCYENSLRLAADHDFDSVAFPAISCGAYHYPIHEAMQIALGTTIEFLGKNTRPRRVLFVLFSQEDFCVYRRAVTEQY